MRPLTAVTASANAPRRRAASISSSRDNRPPAAVCRVARLSRRTAVHSLRVLISQQALLLHRRAERLAQLAHEGHLVGLMVFDWLARTSLFCRRL